MRRVLVTGSRRWRMGTPIFNALVERYEPGAVLIEGEAPGADVISRRLGERIGYKILPFPADWDRYGRSAGPIRNTQMLEEGKPTDVLAFPLPDSKGTWDMIDKALAAGLKVSIFHE